MEALEFISNYNKYLEEIEQVIKPELLPVLQKLKETDPHDLLSHESWLINSNHARGYVWSLFISKCRKE